MWETLLWSGGGDPSAPPSFWLSAAGFATRATWVGGLLLSFVIALLWCFQEKLLFYPGVPQGFETPDKNPKGLRTPAERGMCYEEVWIRTVDNLLLHSWLIKQKPPTLAAEVPTLIFFHGNAGNVGFRLPNVELLYKHVGVNILILSYRGYGFSEGFPTEAGIYRDGEAALDMLLKRHKELNINPEKIFVFGKSLGGAVAIDLATKRPHQIRGVLVENTFTSLADMVLIVFPFLRPVRRFVRIVQRLYMNNDEKVQRLQVPVLFISGQKDELVPSLQMKTLFNLCSSPLKECEEVPLGGHNDTWEWAIGGKAYYEKVKMFLRRALAYRQQLMTEAQTRQKIGEPQESGPDRCSDKGASESQSSLQDQRQRDKARATTLGTNNSGGQVLPAELGQHTDLPLSLSPSDAAVVSVSGAKGLRPSSPSPSKDIGAPSGVSDAKMQEDGDRYNLSGSLGAPPADRAAAAIAAARVITAAAAAASTTAARVAAGNEAYKRPESVQHPLNFREHDKASPCACLDTASRAELENEDVGAAAGGETHNEQHFRQRRQAGVDGDASVRLL